LSRTRVQELIEQGLVLLNGKPAKDSHKVHANDVIRVVPQERPALRAEAEAIPLDVLYEDEDVIAINKAAGMSVHAGAGNSRGTLVNALLGRGQTLSQGSDPLRPGIVHRLDKETSGIVVVAKNDFAHAKLSEGFRQRAIRKTYVALVQGQMENEQGNRAADCTGSEPQDADDGGKTGGVVSECASSTHGLARAGDNRFDEPAGSTTPYRKDSSNSCALFSAGSSGSWRHVIWCGRTIARRAHDPAVAWT